jgi:putative hydrolase of HD superfamily
MEYELNLTYGADKAAFSPFLSALREEVKRDTEKKIEEQVCPTK